MAKRKKEARKLAKAIAESPEFQRLADVIEERDRLEKAAAEARRSDPYRAYVYGLAKSGNPAAQAELDRTRATPDSEARAYAEQLVKGAQSGEARRLAEAELDRIDRATQDRLAETARLRREGWSR
jgi:hypothetical protein